MINNTLSDCLVKSKYGKVLQTALYQQNYVAFKFQKEVRPSTPPSLGAPLLFITVGLYSMFMTIIV